MKSLLRILLPAFVAFGLTMPPTAQAAPTIWRDIKPADIPANGVRQIKPLRARTFKMEPQGLQALLALAPAPGVLDKTLPTLVLPMPEGTSLRFRIAESEVMHPRLAAKFPMIKTYIGTATSNPLITGRFQWDPRGFRGMIFTPKGKVYIDPYARGDNRHYQVYYGSDMPAKRRPPDTVLEPKSPKKPAAPMPGLGLGNFSQRGTDIAGDLRTYRLAIGTTYEYSSYHDPVTVNNPQPRKPVVLAELVNVVNRVSGVYERELGIRMVLIADNDKAIYVTPAQPYTDQAGPAMVQINTVVLDMNVGNENYDIGHVASTGGGGIAGLGVVCNPTRKGDGVTGLGDPIGDPYYIDFVAHEMGHQFGANHTFNGDEATNCGPNANAATAYEPGSGVTIMGYAGICGEQNIADNSIDTFNHASFDEIVNYSRNDEGNTCPVKTTIANNTPQVDAGVGGFVIPKQTPFLLTGAACDADSDALTYQWEQRDLGPAGAPNDAATTTAPLFRPFMPTASPTRVFPQPSDLVNNTQTLGEILPNNNRALNFRLTVRDNKVFPHSGGVGSADLAFTVNAAAGPFLVTAPNTAASHGGGQVIPVTWNVANTDAAPVSCPKVDIALSVDGGFSFPTLLASGVANDGADEVTLPQVSTDMARLRVKCSNNVFFDISNTNFSINKQAPVLFIDAGYEDPDTDGAYTLAWTRPAGATGPDTLQESGACAPGFLDDAEQALMAGSNGKWTGSAQWSSMDNPADGSSAYFVPDLVNQNESLTLASAIAIPAGAAATLSFTTRQGLEDGFDFGHVEVQANNTGAWQSLASYTGPAQGVFDGKRTLDLTRFAGNSVKVRFRIESDAFTVGAPAGWYLDNIAISVSSFTDLVTVPGTSHRIVGHPVGTFCYRLRSAYSVAEGLVPSLDSNVVTLTIASTVPVMLPVARLLASSNRGEAPLTVGFDASMSSASNGRTVAGYRFDFGDGSAAVTQAGALVEHRYTTPGSYTAKVTVTDSEGGVSPAAAEQVIVVTSPTAPPANTAPTARLSSDKTTGTAPLTVLFDAASSSDPDTGDAVASYSYDLDGDGTFETANSPSSRLSRSYTVAGVYTARLMVKDRNGASSNIATRTITVNAPEMTSGNRPPMAVLSAPLSSGAAPLGIEFNGSGSSDPDAGDYAASYRFDFGDGTPVRSSANKVAYHSYAQPGDYVASLVVTDSRGAMSAPKNFPVKVTAPAATPVANGPSIGITRQSGSGAIDPRLLLGLGLLLMGRLRRRH